jgi:hypothetical protein
MKYQDKAGNTRHLYFKIPKDAMQSSVTSLAEDIYIKAVHNGQYKLMNDKMMTALKNEFRNVTDLGNMPPLMRAVQGYKQNYDSFYETEIWSGKEQPEGDASQEYYDGATPARYIQFGHLTGMSPVRSQYFAKQFFTEGNLFGSIIGEFMDGVMGGGFETELGKFMSKEGAEQLKAIPGLRRVLKSTYPRPPEVAEDAQKELNKVKTANDHKFNQVMGKDKSINEIAGEDIDALLEEVMATDGPYEAERIRDKFNNRMKTEGVSSPVSKLKWFAPEVRALGFYQLLKNTPSKENELWEQAELANLTSDRFKQEVGRLIDQEGGKSE